MGGHNKTDCRLQTVHSAQTVQTVQFFCLLFLLNCDVHMIKVYTLFLTLLVTLELFPIFEQHMTKFYKVIFELTLSNKIKLQAQVSWAHGDYPYSERCVANVICVDSDTDLAVRNVLCRWSKWLPRSSQDSLKNFTKKKVLNHKI